MIWRHLLSASLSNAFLSGGTSYHGPGNKREIDCIRQTTATGSAVPCRAPALLDPDSTLIHWFHMRKLYKKWMVNGETRLTTADTNRVVRPFEWGIEWTRAWPFVNGNYPRNSEGYERYLHELNQAIVQHSDEFFAYHVPTDFWL